MRLTIRNSDGSVSQPTDLKWSEALEKLAYYEDLEEKGLLLNLPCCIGNRVWRICDMSHTAYKSFISYEEIVHYGYCYRNVMGGLSPLKASDYGKTWFLTQKEAEAALKEREK